LSKIGLNTGILDYSNLIYAKDNKSNLISFYSGKRKKNEISGRLYLSFPKRMAATSFSPSG
jgi:hypothetical protein